MRADRLVAIVLLLQAHGQRTAGQLADELETSERTIRRDLEALSGAGVPVYAQRGRGGGWALAGRHRIDLSGLTAREARSLVLAAAGAPDQGDVEAALRKVLAALPPMLRDQVEAARARIHVDPSAWGRLGGRTAGEGVGSGDAGILDLLRHALETGVQVELGYARPGHEPSWRRVHPHGLVVKRGAWYLVATAPSGLRTYKVSRIEAAELTDEPAATPEGFDLAATWEAAQRSLVARRPSAEVTVDVLVDPRAWPVLSRRLGGWWEIVDLGPEPDGRRRALVSMASASHAARELLGFAEAVEVRAPPEVCAELAALGRRLFEQYSPVAP